MIMRQKGQTLIEFAFVAPIVVFLFLSILYFGTMFMEYIQYNNAARDAARAVAELLPQLHFVPASIIFIFLFNVLFDLKQGEPFNFKSIAISLLISVVCSYGVWYLFFKLFNITLP